jgi:hypothetical protein
MKEITIYTFLSDDCRILEGADIQYIQATTSQAYEGVFKLPISITPNKELIGSCVDALLNGFRDHLVEQIMEKLNG